MTIIELIKMGNHRLDRAIMLSGLALFFSLQPMPFIENYCVQTLAIHTTYFLDKSSKRIWEITAFPLMTLAESMQLLSYKFVKLSLTTEDSSITSFSRILVTWNS